MLAGKDLSVSEVVFVRVCKSAQKTVRKPELFLL
jgi:hypothetical protein